MRGVACLEAAKMAGGFVSQWRGMAWFGALWRGLGRGELKSERKSAEGAKKTRGGGWVLWAHIGPPMGPGGVARLGRFLRTKKWSCGVFVGKNGVRFSNFSLERGCAKRVLNAHHRRDSLCAATTQATGWRLG